MSEQQQAPARRPQPPQQAQQPARARSELSREELRAHLANVESQVKSALRIIASESKGTQQAHSALRADLSSALVRLQADMNGSASELAAKLDRLGAEVSFLSRQRRISRIIFATFGMTLSFVLGVLVIVGWLLVKEGMLQTMVPPLPLEDMLDRSKSGKATMGGTGAPAASQLNERPQRPSREPPSAQPQESEATPANPGVGTSTLPGAVERQPLSAPGKQGQSEVIVPPPIAPLSSPAPDLPAGLIQSAPRPTRQ